MASPQTTPWTEAERGFVLRAIRRGVSYTKIAERFDLNRNVVAGRIFRDEELKHAKPRKPGARAKKKRAMRVAEKEKKDLIDRTVVPIAAAIVAPLVVGRTSVPSVPRTQSLVPDMRGSDPGLPAAQPEPESMRGEWKPLVDLVRDQCRWPVVEDHTVTGHFLFCAAPLPPDQTSSYCKRHAARAHSARAGGA